MKSVGLFFTFGLFAAFSSSAQMYLNLRLPVSVQAFAERPADLQTKTVQAPLEGIFFAQSPPKPESSLTFWGEGRLGLLLDGGGPLLAGRGGLGWDLGSNLKIYVCAGGLLQTISVSDSWRQSPYARRGLEALSTLEWQTPAQLLAFRVHYLEVDAALLSQAEDLETSSAQEGRWGLRLEGQQALGEKFSLGGLWEMIRLPKTALASTQFAFVLPPRWVQRAELRLHWRHGNWEPALGVGRVWGVADALEHMQQATLFLDGHLLAQTYVTGEWKWHF